MWYKRFLVRGLLHSTSTLAVTMLRATILLALCASAFAQTNLFNMPVTTDGKSHDAPPPTLVEMPYERVSMPNLGLAEVSETSATSVNLPSPLLDVPKGLEGVVDIPHATIPMPKGGFEEEQVEVKVQQPIIEVPNPIMQKKKVFFNVPQPIIQVPEPVIRHRPILYKVPHIVRLQKPIVKHEKIFYKVPQAQLASKSGYNFN